MKVNHTREIVVSNSPGAAYQALTVDFDKWWTTGCNPVSEIGDTVTFRFGPTYWLMRANNLVPDTSVELECIEAHHVHEGMSSSILNEWKGTKLKWEIRKHNGKTRIALVH